MILQRVFLDNSREYTVLREQPGVHQYHQQVMQTCSSVLVDLLDNKLHQTVDTCLYKYVFGYITAPLK